MGNAVLHRGPDTGATYLDPHIGLVHRRLSIIDLSVDGNQPMHSADGRYVIVFNGEIYNFLELRADLEKQNHVFRTRTDTEVILTLFALEGPQCLDRLFGMFAFAIWDREEKNLFLARDRIGKKPLYYYHDGGDRLAFASELKSILQIPEVSRDIDPTAVLDYLKYLCVPGSKSIFRKIHKLLPGHCLRLKMGGAPSIRQYWDVRFNPDSTWTAESAAEQLLDLLNTATKCRMISDVPLGSFLSGGADSSAVVALMARNSTGPVKTCTIGFNDRDHDETPFARQVSELLQTQHVEFFVTGNIADTVRLLPKYFDEPFADSSAVPTFHVSRLARKAVTVALAGDGGDESFGGYQKYGIDMIVDRFRQMVPRPFLRLGHSLLKSIDSNLALRGRTATFQALQEPGQAFYLTNTFISDELAEELLSPLRSEIKDYDPSDYLLGYWQKAEGPDFLSKMLYTDLKTYLPDDILVKVDRMSMAHSLEVRAPFLDHRIVEFAASLPSHLKIQNGQQKYVLKKALRSLLPDSILDRKKHGFTVPLESWFRNELRNLAEEKILAGGAMSEIFSSKSLHSIWNEHQSRKTDHGTLLWSLLMFALWHEEYVSR
jgi:asparagine synthase (glutamine-hydrolysing)